MARLSNSYQAVLRSAIDSEKLAAVSWGAEALWKRLLLAVDGSGRFWGDAQMVACKAAAKRIGRSTSFDEIESFLVELERVDLIRRWSLGHERYLMIVNYFDGKRGDRDRPTLFPDPPERAASPNVPPCPQPSPDVPAPGTHVPLARARPEPDRDREPDRDLEPEPEQSPPRASACACEADAPVPALAAVAAPPVSPPAKRKPPSGDHAALIEAWCAVWLETRGEPYAVKGGQDGQAAKWALKQAPLEECVVRLRRLLESEDEFLRRAVDGIAWLRKRWNLLGAAASPPTSERGASVDRPEDVAAERWARMVRALEERVTGSLAEINRQPRWIVLGAIRQALIQSLPQIPPGLGHNDELSARDRRDNADPAPAVIAWLVDLNARAAEHGAPWLRAALLAGPRPEVYLAPGFGRAPRIARAV